MSRKEQFELDLLTLALTLEGLGARSGIEMTLAELAANLDWTMSRLKRRISWSHSHPEYGLAVHVRRGNRRLIVLTYNGEADSTSTGSVVEMAVAEKSENITRVCRSACKAVLHELATDKRRTQAKELSREVEIVVTMLRNIRLVLRADEQGNQKLIQSIDSVLAIVDGRWNGDE